MALRAWQVILFVIVAGTGIPVYLHAQKYGGLNWAQASLAFFLALNLLICTWEICLGKYITEIEAEWKSLEQKFGAKRGAAVMEFFFQPLSLAQVFSLRTWTRVWSTYSLYDPSYSNRQSFGFFVDVGNGWYTLPSSALFLAGMTWDVLPPFALGIIGLTMFHTAWYGTCIYFLSFFFNGRHKGKSLAEVVGFVGTSNGLWFVFPALGMYVSYTMLASSSMAAVRLPDVKLQL